eukprot:CAMPEP_0113870616 /NCGR_PEP_ID=MMETSP0780_2-20120614/2188_1 /TAXON_ID=652834 /ORGANISM="Palpitomonas bilix" /LENGTH=288 /DNA_ID=CAMNT_0000855919 /DNA_START=88 /DNA_END=954 /DNA_ORIENTATION=- /assembly_acc=CAM_ASM_000599
MRRQSDPTSGFKWRKDAEEEEEEEGEDPPKEALSSSGIIPSYPKTTEAAREYFTSMSYESKDYVEKALGKKLSTHGMLLRGRPKPRPILGERASPEPLLESIPLDLRRGVPYLPSHMQELPAQVYPAVKNEGRREDLHVEAGGEENTSTREGRLLSMGSISEGKSSGSRDRSSSQEKQSKGASTSESDDSHRRRLPPAAVAFLERWAEANLDKLDEEVFKSSGRPKEVRRGTLIALEKETGLTHIQIKEWIRRYRSRRIKDSFRSVGAIAPSGRKLGKLRQEYEAFHK